MGDLNETVIDSALSTYTSNFSLCSLITLPTFLNQMMADALTWFSQIKGEFSKVLIS